MIQLNKICKAFSDNVVLKDVDMTIVNGKSLVILGASGTGKSVLIKSIIGIVDVDSGSINIDGKEISNLRLQDRMKAIAQIGFLFQYNALFDSMTVGDNITFMLKEAKGIDEKTRANIAAQWLEKVELSPAVANQYPSELSGGMQRRVALARTLATEPKYVFFDEPVTGLDPLTASKIDALIAKLIKENNLTAVTITHSLESTKILGEEIIFLHGTGIHWQGDRNSFFESRDPILTDFIHSYNNVKHI